MKLLNPFAGYRYAAGHLLYHAAFFIGSFTVMIFGNEQQELDEFNCGDKICNEILEYKYKEEALYAIWFLRCAHAVVIVLQAISYKLDNYNPENKKLLKVEPDRDRPPTEIELIDSVRSLAKEEPEPTKIGHLPPPISLTDPIEQYDFPINSASDSPNLSTQR